MQTLKVHLDGTYFVETKNWKHYNKMIFKYVNNNVSLIFNKKINKKWSLLNCALFNIEKSKHAAKKKRKRVSAGPQPDTKKF